MTFHDTSHGVPMPGEARPSRERGPPPPLPQALRDAHISFRSAPGAPVGPARPCSAPIRHPREGGGPSMAPDAAATGGEQGEPLAAAAKTKAGPRLGGRGDGRGRAIQSQRKQMCDTNDHRLEPIPIAADKPLSRLRGRPGGGPLPRQRERQAKPGKGARHAERPSPNPSRRAGGEHDVTPPT